MSILQIPRRGMMGSAGGAKRPDWIQPDVADTKVNIQSGSFNIPLGVSLGDWGRIIIEITFVNTPFYAVLVCTLTDIEVKDDYPGERSLFFTVNGARTSISRRSLPQNIKHSITINRFSDSGSERFGNGGTGELMLFTSPSNRVANLRFHRIAIYDRDLNLVYEGVPALDENNDACVYDTVSGVLHKRTGTTPLKWGYDE